MPSHHLFLLSLDLSLRHAALSHQVKSGFMQNFQITNTIHNVDNMQQIKTTFIY